MSQIELALEAIEGLRRCYLLAANLFAEAVSLPVTGAHARMMWDQHDRLRREGADMARWIHNWSAQLLRAASNLGMADELLAQCMVGELLPLSGDVVGGVVTIGPRWRKADLMCAFGALDVARAHVAAKAAAAGEKQPPEPLAPAADEGPPDEAFMTHAELAKAFGVSKDAARKRLERWREDHDAGWIENGNAGRHDCRCVYLVGAVRHLFERPPASTVCPARKNFAPKTT